MSLGALATLYLAGIAGLALCTMAVAWLLTRAGAVFLAWKFRRYP